MRFDHGIPFDFFAFYLKEIGNAYCVYFVSFFSLLGFHFAFYHFFRDFFRAFLWIGEWETEIFFVLCGANDYCVCRDFDGCSRFLSFLIFSRFFAEAFANLRTLCISERKIPMVWHDSSNSSNHRNILLLNVVLDTIFSVLKLTGLKKRVSKYI